MTPTREHWTWGWERCHYGNRSRPSCWPLRSGVLSWTSTQSSSWMRGELLTMRVGKQQQQQQNNNPYRYRQESQTTELHQNDRGATEDKSLRTNEGTNALHHHQHIQRSHHTRVRCPWSTHQSPETVSLLRNCLLHDSWLVLVPIGVCSSYIALLLVCC